MSQVPKIMVLGANGMLGHMLSRFLETRGFMVTGLTRPLYDVSMEPIEKIERYVVPGDFLVNCVVNNAASMDYKESIAVNSVFPVKLSYFCAQRGVRMIHISTNAVFSGAKGNYLENDLPDPVDLYGISKLLGENGNCMVLRTSIIGPEESTRRYFLQWAISHKDNEVNGYTNHLWNGVTTQALSEAIERICIKDLYMKGIFHIHSPDTMSKYELLRICSKAYGLNLKINPLEAPTACDRSLSSISELSKGLVGKDIEAQVSELSRVDF